MSTYTDDQRAQRRAIEATRARRGIIPVRLHHVPRWLSKRIRHRFDFQGRRYANWEIVQRAIESIEKEIGGFVPTWLDHWGTAVHDGVECFVSEPYLSDSAMPAIERFAEIGGFVFASHGKAMSWWFPDNTTRLVFRPVEDKAEHVAAIAAMLAKDGRLQTADKLPNRQSIGTTLRSLPIF